MYEIEVLRRPLVFGRAHGSVTLSEGGVVATGGVGGGWRSAASKVMMRSGRHYVQFTLLASCSWPESFSACSGRAGTWREG